MTWNSHGIRLNFRRFMIENENPCNIFYSVSYRRTVKNSMETNYVGTNLDLCVVIIALLFYPHTPPINLPVDLI